jgi:uncharacterized protein (DUF433 family)
MEAGKRGGKPCIRDLRITVCDLLEYLASGMSQEEILNDFPDLEAEDIRACLNFAADRERKLFAPCLKLLQSVMQLFSSFPASESLE